MSTMTAILVARLETEMELAQLHLKEAKKIAKQLAEEA